MAIIYVRSTDGNNSDNGSTWALAKATIAGAFAIAAAGDTVYVSKNHAETVNNSAISLAGPATSNPPVNIICVDDAAEPPTTLATTATVTTTGSGAITFSGFCYYYGISFSSSTGANSSSISLGGGSSVCIKFEKCAFSLPGTSGGVLTVGSTTRTSQFFEFINTTFSFGTINGQIANNCNYIWRDTPSGVQGATIPTTLFNYGGVSSPGGLALIKNVDLSALGSGKKIVSVSGNITNRFSFENCKLNASVTKIANSSNGQNGIQVRFVNCDSGNTNYNYSLHKYEGTVTTETTVVRTGGGSNGTTTTSSKLVSSANSKFYYPLETDWIDTWIDSTSSTTLTLHVLTDNVTLTDADCWLEVEYLGTSGYPQGVTINDRAANILATPTNQTTSSETWTTTGITTPVKQKLSVTFTPASKGVVRARVVLAKASTTVYADNKVEVS